MSTFRLFLIQLLTTCSHSSLDSFSFTSKPMNRRDYRCPYFTRSSIFLDLNSSWDSKYVTFPSKLVISSFNFSMDASLAFSFSSNVDIFSVKFFIRALDSSIKLLRESISLFDTRFLIGSSK